MVTTNPFSMEETSQLVAESVRVGETETLYTREIDVDGQAGILYLTRTRVGETEAFVTKRVVAFGGDDFSWIITATSKNTFETKHGEEIMKMLLNIQIAEEGPVANGDEVDFQITPNRLVLTRCVSVMG